MTKFRLLLQDHALKLGFGAALVTLLISGALIVVSIQGLPEQMLKFTAAVQQDLPDGVDIAGWASFDRDSYVVGEPIGYKVRILYRDDRIVPDLDQFVRSVSFLPIEKRENVQNFDSLAGNVSEYTLEYVLQGVDVRPNSSYELDPAVLFYRTVGAVERALQSIQIPTPSVFFTEYYPQDVSAVPLLPLKKEFDDSYWLRVGVTGICGVIFISLCILLLWRFGRRREITELSVPEVIWHEFRNLEKSTLDKREYLLACEKLVIRLLESCAGLSPRAFWLGKDPDGEFWKNFSAQMRQEFFNNYRPWRATQVNIEHVTSMLDKTFASIVEEDLLNREKEPSFINRITQQRDVLATSGICLALGIAMFVLAGFPNLWVSRDLLDYNSAVTSLSAAIPIIEESAPFAELGEQSEIEAIKAAALYNAGTIRAHIKPSNNPAMQEKELLEVVFQEQLSLDTYIEDEESAEIFFASAGWLQEGKQYLQEAVRINPHDDDTIRNLELVSKRHAAVVAAIRSLFESLQGKNELKVSSKLETLVDVLNPEWPDEVEEQEEEEHYTRTYKISERF